MQQAALLDTVTLQLHSTRAVEIYLSMIKVYSQQLTAIKWTQGRAFAVLHSVKSEISLYRHLLKAEMKYCKMFYS
jgi:hypothetical protein